MAKAKRRRAANAPATKTVVGLAARLLGVALEARPAARRPKAKAKKAPAAGRSKKRPGRPSGPRPKR